MTSGGKQNAAAIKAAPLIGSDFDVRQATSEPVSSRPLRSNPFCRLSRPFQLPGSNSTANGRKRYSQVINKTDDIDKKDDLSQKG
jgi:hypothetical protein